MLKLTEQIKTKTQIHKMHASVKGRLCIPTG